MSHFPLEAWADRNPHVRWPLVIAIVFILCCLGSLND